MRPKKDGISNCLADLRRQRGCSAAELAESVGVSRQTIHAIEANTYIPNTALALRLAGVLEVTVEEIFQMSSEPAVSRSNIAVDLIDDSDAKPGQPVQLCQVGRTTVAVPSYPVPMYLPLADAVLLPVGKASSSRRSAVPIRPGPIPDRLLIGGCDPALSILAAHAREAGLDVALAGCNSTRALELLQRGHIHIAGTHLHDPATGESNTHAVDRRFKRGTVRVITFASWQEGFVVAPGKAGKVRSAADLSDEKIQIVNREPGAGSRILLDLELKKAGVARRDVRGYDRIARGHLPAAWHVLSGLADCCIATESAARAFGLDFIPIRSERFDLVLPNELASSPLAQRLLEAMQRSAFRHALQALGGYDTGHTGRVVT